MLGDLIYSFQFNYLHFNMVLKTYQVTPAFAPVVVGGSGSALQDLQLGTNGISDIVALMNACKTTNSLHSLGLVFIILKYLFSQFFHTYTLKM